jgi:hypothetical protein
MSPDKEPAVFTKHWREGIDHYRSCFIGYDGEPAIGEATVEYMVDPGAPQRIAEALPDVKLIFTLRDPIARAHSHYWHRVKTGHETRSLDEVLAGDEAEYPIRYSCYHTQLKRYLALFSPNQIHVVIMEDMKRDPLATFQDVFAFIGVDPNFSVPYRGARNTAKVPRSWVFQVALTRIQATRWVQSLIPDIARPRIAKVYTELKRRNLRSYDAPPLAPQYVVRLAGIFKREISGIEHMIGRTLSEWRAPYSPLLDEPFQYDGSASA